MPNNEAITEPEKYLGTGGERCGFLCSLALQDCAHRTEGAGEVLDDCVIFTCSLGGASAHVSVEMLSHEAKSQARDVFEHRRSLRTGGAGEILDGCVIFITQSSSTRS